MTGQKDGQPTGCRDKSDVDEKSRDDRKERPGEAWRGLERHERACKDLERPGEPRPETE